eukprot:jgi/Botrbrau1/15059/Bobra.118_2s0007.1
MSNFKERCVATYVWIGEDSGNDIRSLRRVLSYKPNGISDVPVAVCDGTYLSAPSGLPSVLVLHPASLYDNPHSPERDVVVLCQPVWMHIPTAEDKGQIHSMAANRRDTCESIMRRASDHEPEFVVVQEYSLRDARTNQPLGGAHLETPKTGKSYCAVGSRFVAGRSFSDKHMDFCLAAKLQVGGNYPLSCQGQFAYLLGPCQGIELADQLIISRWLLQQLSEEFGVIVDMNQNPCPGRWQPTGAFLRYRTTQTSGPQGLAEIHRHMRCLKMNHHTMQNFYRGFSKDNDNLQTAASTAGNAAGFTWGIENRGASVRIPLHVHCQGGGYYEDRRPASDVEPYLATSILVCATLGIPFPFADLQFDADSKPLPSQDEDAMSECGSCNFTEGQLESEGQLDSEEATIGPSSVPNATRLHGAFFPLGSSP